MTTWIAKNSYPGRVQERQCLSLKILPLFFEGEGNTRSEVARNPVIDSVIYSHPPPSRRGMTSEVAII
jgi:hypothetical protein